MPRARELPVAPINLKATGPNTQSQRPDNEWAAIMEAAPHTDIPLSIKQLLPLKELLAIAIDRLPEEERQVIELVVLAGMSIRQTANQLHKSKSHIWRVRDRALIRLRTELIQHELVREYLHDPDL